MQSKKMDNERLYLQRMMESHKRPASILVITCGKGGLIKTNMAANSAICLAALREKVLLIGNRFAGRVSLIVHDGF
jgi:Mrp family chromosome partitioning ATPase